MSDPEREIEDELRKQLATMNARIDDAREQYHVGIIRDAAWRRTFVVVRRGVMVGVCCLHDLELTEAQQDMGRRIRRAFSDACWALNEPDLLHAALQEQYTVARMLRP